LGFGVDSFRGWLGFDVEDSFGACFGVDFCAGAFAGSLSTFLGPSFGGFRF